MTEDIENEDSTKKTQLVIGIIIAIIGVLLVIIAVIMMIRGEPNTSKMNITYVSKTPESMGMI